MMIKYGIKPNWEFFIRPLSCVKEYWNILKLILINQCAVIQRMVEQTSTIITLFFAFNLFASLPIWMNALISLPQMTNMEEPQLSNKDHVLWITVTDNMIKSTGYQSSQSSLSNYWTSFYRCVSKNLTKNKDYTFTLHKVKRSCRGGARSKNVLQMTQTA